MFALPASEFIVGRSCLAYDTTNSISLQNLFNAGVFHRPNGVAVAIKILAPSVVDSHEVDIWVVSSTYFMLASLTCDAPQYSR